MEPCEGMMIGSTIIISGDELDTKLSISITFMGSYCIIQGIALL